MATMHPSFMLATAGLVAAAVACSGGTPMARQAAQQHPPSATARLGLTTDVPKSITRACQALQARLRDEGTRRRVACPPLAPAGSARAEAVPLAGVRPGRPGRSYIIDVHSEALADAGKSDGHWLVAAGTRSGLRIAGLVDLVPAPATRVSIAKRWGRLLLMPPFPQGGVNGGHAVVEFTVGRTTHVVSLHGHRNARRAIAMARALGKSLLPAS